VLPDVQRAAGTDTMPWMLDARCAALLSACGLGLAFLVRAMVVAVAHFACALFLKWICPTAMPTQSRLEITGRQLQFVDDLF
jgi:hypothetical protein